MEVGLGLQRIDVTSKTAGSAPNRRDNRHHRGLRRGSDGIAATGCATGIGRRMALAVAKPEAGVPTCRSCLIFAFRFFFQKGAKDKLGGLPLQYDCAKY